MTRNTVFCAGTSAAVKYAGQFLRSAGINLSESPGWDTGHLLLDVPTFHSGLWPEKELDTLLSSLPRDVVVWGGMMNHPALDGFRKIDLLQKEDYLLQNARITAECTIPIAESHMKRAWPDSPTLIIGWGRIGKALAPLLRDRGCPVTVASSSSSKQEEIRQAGFLSADASALTLLLADFRLVINAAPAMVITEAASGLCRDCIKIDLASKKGIAGDYVLWERGLPGRFAPERSGKLIADTFLRLFQEVSP